MTNKTKLCWNPLNNSYSDHTFVEHRISLKDGTWVYFQNGDAIDKDWNRHDLAERNNLKLIKR